MCGRDAKPTELDGDGRCEVAGGLERIDRFERVSAVAVVFVCAGGEPRGELLSDRHEAGAGFGTGCEFDWHSDFSDPLVIDPWRERGSGHGPDASRSY